MKRWGSLAITAAIIAGTVPAVGHAAKGSLVFNSCRGCHAVGPGARNKAGPQLNGIVGRKAAAVPGFEYSDALKAAAAKGLVWTEPKLSAYLESPETFLPGGVMAYSGVQDAGQLKDLIAFLKTQK
jgi:cytochrome c